MLSASAVTSCAFGVPGAGRLWHHMRCTLQPLATVRCENVERWHLRAQVVALQQRCQQQPLRLRALALSGLLMKRLVKLEEPEAKLAN